MIVLRLDLNVVCFKVSNFVRPGVGVLECSQLRMAKKKGLGRGLEALLSPSASADDPASAAQLRDLGVDSRGSRVTLVPVKLELSKYCAFKPSPPPLFGNRRFWGTICSDWLADDQ